MHPPRHSPRHSTGPELVSSAGSGPGAASRALLVHDYLGHPFQIDLSNALANRGHPVAHLYRADRVGPQGPLVQRTSGAVITPVTAAGPAGPEAARRYADAVRRACVAAVHGWDGRAAPHSVTLLTGNAPPLVQWELLREARKHGWRYVYWLQDMYGTAEPWEADALRGSDRVVAVTEEFARAAVAAGVAPEHVTVIRNWAPLDEPDPPAAAPLWPPAARFVRANQPILLYAGTLDRRHAPELLAGLAAACTEAALGQVIVVSQGEGRELLERRRAERGLDRLTLLDLRPHQEVRAMLAAADVLLVTLAREAAGVSAPSKLLAYLAAGRCVLAAAPAGTETARVVAESGGGEVADPGDPTGFAAAALRLLGDPERRRAYAASARAWARRSFRLPDIADRFQQVL